MVVVGVIAAALAVACAILCLHAQRPKKGTLEWIEQYDRPDWHIPEPSPRFDGFDWLWSLIPASLCGGLWIAVAMLGEMPLAAAVWPAFLTGMLCYLLTRLLGGSVLTSLIASLLLLTMADLPAMMLPPAGILLLLWMWVRQGYGAWSWIYLAGCGLLLAAFQMILPESVLLLIPILAVLLLTVIRRVRCGECGFWRILPTVLIVPAVFLLAEGVYDGILLGIGFPALLSDDRFWGFLLMRLTPEWNVGGWHLEQLLWFDLPCAMALVAGTPPLFAAARRREGTAWYLLIWNLFTAALWCVTAADLLPLTATLTCAWLARRMQIRKHRTLTILILAVPAATTLALTAVHLFHLIGGF